MAISSDSFKEDNANFQKILQNKLQEFCILSGQVSPSPCPSFSLLLQLQVSPQNHSVFCLADPLLPLSGVNSSFNLEADSTPSPVLPHVKTDQSSTPKGVLHWTEYLRIIPVLSFQVLPHQHLHFELSNWKERPLPIPALVFLDWFSPHRASGNTKRVLNLSTITENTSLLLLGLNHKCGTALHLHDSWFMLEGPTKKAQS